LRVDCSELFIVVLRKGHIGSLLNFGLELCLETFIKSDFRRGKDRSLSQGKVGVVNEAAEEPYEGLLELVVALSGDVVVLEVLLTVESDLLGLDLAVLDINLVADKYDGDVLAHAGKILVPLGDVGVGDTGAHIEHDDTAVATNVVTITETTELFLAGSVPNAELNLAVGGVEGHGVNLDTKSGDVFLLELTGQMTLHEGSLADTTVTAEDELEFGNLLFNHLLFL